jgi:hypothetical protein
VRKAVSVDALLAQAKKEGVLVERLDLVKELKAFEGRGFGRFIVGRRGKASRFEPSKAATAAAPENGERAEASATTSYVEAESTEPVPMGQILHRFNLRPNFEVEIRLPDDLSEREAERLAAYIRTLPFTL